MEWCLPGFLLVPEICGGPFFMFFIGLEVWLFLAFLHVAIPIAVVSALFDTKKGG